MHKERTGIVILAAGASTRMGTAKQLILIEGVPLLRHTVKAAVDCKCGAVVVVVGANADLVSPALEGLDVIIAVNSEWNLGMSTSIRYGLGTLLAIAPETEGVLLMPADLPQITHDSLLRIIEARAQNAAGLAAARYNGIIGAPAFFSRDYFDDLLQLEGEAGARSLLARYAEQVLPVELPEAALDLDTPEDFAIFKGTLPERAFAAPDPADDIAHGHSRRQFIANVTVAGAGTVVAPAFFQAVNAAEAPAAPSPPAMTVNSVPVKLRVNGAEQALELDPRATLLDVLRERLGLTGSKKGCDHGQCGACTVLVNGRRINACLALAVVHDGDEITTIEGLAQGDELHPVQAAFLEHDGFQCGYCTPGQICSAVALLKEGHANDDGEIREWMSGNICRCGAYLNIVAAIREAKSKTAGAI